MMKEKGITAEEINLAKLFSGSTYNIWGVVTFLKWRATKDSQVVFTMNTARCSFAVFIFL